MKTRIYTLEFKLFFRNKSTWMGILVLLITGFASLYFGHTFIERQKNVIAKAASLQQENTKNNIHHFGDELGLLMFHNKFSVANIPNQWASFANGQRDVNPYLISVTILGLEGQIYDTDINNPVSLLMGNMDLSFVFIFLFPLIIIAFGYNIFSAERENGTWPLLRAQTDKPFILIWRKLLVRMITIFAVALILLASAILFLQLPLNLNLLSIAAILFLYLLFWFALVMLVVSFFKSSNFNASALVACWVLFCVVIPGALNLALSHFYPIPEALQNVVNQREGYHEKWDMEKDRSLKPFYNHYPQYKKYPFPEEKSFSWYWYFAMQQQGDDEAAGSKKSVSDKLDARASFTKIASYFVPSIQTQLFINNIAGSDLNQHLQFQQEVRRYHEELRLHFYPSIFQELDVTQSGIEKFGLKKYDQNTQSAQNASLFSMLLLTTCLALLATQNLKKLRV